MTSICFECRVLACTQASIYTRTEWPNQRKSISVFHINLFIGPGSLNRQLVYWGAHIGMSIKNLLTPSPTFQIFVKSVLTTAGSCHEHLGHGLEKDYLKLPLVPMGVLSPVSVYK